jgi:hypothetical protein
MLKYWPCTNPSKEVLFLNELEEVTIDILIKITGH